MARPNIQQRGGFRRHRFSAEHSPRPAANLTSMGQESGTTPLSEGLKQPFGAPREPVRNSHAEKRARFGSGLKKKESRDRVTAKAANRMPALVANMLRDFGQEIQAVEDLVRKLQSAWQVAAGGTGKAAAPVLISAR